MSKWRMPGCSPIANNSRGELVGDFSAALPVFVFRPDREQRMRDRVERQTQHVVGRVLQRAVRALFPDPRIADSGRYARHWRGPEVRVKRRATQPERLGHHRADCRGLTAQRTVGRRRHGVVVRHTLGERELGRAVVVVVAVEADVDVQETRRPRDEAEPDRGRARLAVDGRPRQRRRGQHAVDRLRHQRIAGVLQHSGGDVGRRARPVRQPDRRRRIHADERIRGRQRQPAARRRRTGIDGAERVVERHAGDVVVEPRAGVAGAQQQSIPRELRRRVDVGHRVLDRRRHLDQAAVAEAAAVRQRALAIGPPHLAFHGQVRRREVFESGVEDVAPGFRVELDGVGIEDVDDRRRRRLHLSLKRVVDLQHPVRALGKQRSRRPAQQHGNLIPLEPRFDLPGTDDVAAEPLVLAADVIGHEIEEPAPALAIEPHAFERQPVAKVAIAFVAGAVTRQAGPAHAEVDGAGERRRLGRLRGRGCR